MYSSMWILKPYPGKMDASKKTVKKMCAKWKKHGAVEANAAILFGADYGHIGMIVRCKSMEHYGKCNDKLNADPQVIKLLKEGELNGEIIRHTLGRRFT